MPTTTVAKNRYVGRWKIDMRLNFDDLQNEVKHQKRTFTQFGRCRKQALMVVCEAVDAAFFNTTITNRGIMVYLDPDAIKLIEEARDARRG